MILDEEEASTRTSIAKVGDALCAILNDYAMVPRNNMNEFAYRGVTNFTDPEDRHALDYYVLTKDVVSFATNYYRDEIRTGAFFTDAAFGDALFERETNKANLQATMNRNF